MNKQILQLTEKESVTRISERLKELRADFLLAVQMVQTLPTERTHSTLNFLIESILDGATEHKQGVAGIAFEDTYEDYSRKEHVFNEMDTIYFVFLKGPRNSIELNGNSLWPEYWLRMTIAQATANLLSTYDSEEESSPHWYEFNTTLLRDDDYKRYLAQYDKRRKSEEDHSNKRVWKLESSPSIVDS